MKFDIDRKVFFEAPRRETAVVGWCCFDDMTPVRELWLEIDGRRVPCLTGLERPDVARAYNAPTLSTSGFLTRAVVNPRSNARLIAPRDRKEHVVGEFVPGWQPPRPRRRVAHDYTWWLHTCEPRLFSSQDQADRRLAALTQRPLISIVLPTHNTQLYHLERCIDSVMAQHYPFWQLCVCDDGSGEPLQQYLRTRAAAEPRIRVSFSDQQRGISSASNVAIANATGEFLVLLDHDDELHPAALFEIAREIDGFPQADLLYSDEDKIDQLGIRSSPAFKPDFDDDLLSAFNYIGHLVALRTELVRALGGFRRDSDGAQDWDLLLRASATIGPEKIRHIAKPLYHWRMHEGSTAMSLTAKPYAVRAWNRVLERHVESNGPASVTPGLFFGSMRVARRLSPTYRVAVVCRAQDGSHQQQALSRTRKPCRVELFEVMLAAVRRAEHLQASALTSVDELDAETTIVINARLEGVNHIFIEELAAQAERGDCGLVGGTILDAEGAILTAGLACRQDGTYINPFEGLRLDDAGYMGQCRVLRSVAALGPQVFAFRTARLRTAGGLAAMAEDRLADLCVTLTRAAHAEGLKVIHTPYAVATLRPAIAPFTPRHQRKAPSHLLVNANLEMFPDVAATLRNGFH